MNANRASKELVGVGDQMKMAREHALLPTFGELAQLLPATRLRLTMIGPYAPADAPPTRFDGADGDDGNAQDDVGGLDLTDDDFRWVTTRLCATVGKSCGVVSVLEGGYGTWDADEGKFDRSSLASGCAAHVSEPWCICDWAYSEYTSKGGSLSIDCAGTASHCKALTGC